jgi:diketogulonate reductase-like aldo/keto reductase
MELKELYAMSSRIAGMEYHELCPNVRVPVLGVGTWKIGGQLEKDTIRDEQETTAIETAIRMGMTHIDTAERYGDGHAEELVGEAIKGSERRTLFITTKVESQNLRYEDVISAMRGSLERLGTSYVDLYLIHFPSKEIPIKETMQAMDFLVDNGLSRFIGVSNFPVERMKEAQKHSRHKIVANQIEYNLVTRNRGKFTNEMESTIIPYCRRNNITIIAFSPLAEGKLGKPGLRVLDVLAQKYGKTQAQIALNWLISQPGILTIPKAAKVEHVQENIGALGWRLTEEDTRKLDSIV